jgi:segregation and condensation protein A
MIDERPDRQLTLSLEEDVFKHLLFHKSLIDDEPTASPSRLDRYISVLSSMKEGEHVSIRDSYSRSIAMILELAIDEYLDPWDVDLIRFCKMFIKRLEENDRVNLLVVGKLIKMACTVLLLKSVSTLEKAETVEEDEDLSDDSTMDWLEDDEGYKVTAGIIGGNEVLVESLVHKGDRPVTLLDLLDALQEVDDEVALMQENRSRHRDEIRSLDTMNRGEINRKMLTENVEEEIHLTWQRVNQFNGHPIPLSDIIKGFELDDTTTFISLLYLSKMSRILLSQKSFPEGEIYVKNVSAGEKLEFGELKENLDRINAGGKKLSPPDIIVEERPIPNNWNT